MNQLSSAAARMAADAATSAPLAGPAIRTPDQRLRVFVSSTLEELREERVAVREAIEGLHLTPVMFELGARAHPSRALYQSYLEQSQVFIGIYWQRYGWVAPGNTISGLMEEFEMAERRGMPQLLYVKLPAPDRDPQLTEFIQQIEHEAQITYRVFSTPEELGRVVRDDLAILLSERFEQAREPALPSLEPESMRETGEGWILPNTANRFIGREAEQQAVHDLLAREDVRLVTLIGPGGIGKTRLALSMADRLRDLFPDGICFVRLASVPQSDLVPSVIAEAVGLNPPVGVSPMDAVARYLRGQRVLLILDNFEHVVEAAPAVAELIEETEPLKVLVTSREVLRLSGEHEVSIPALSLPQPDYLLTVERLMESEAVRLFVERAQALNPSFRLTEENAWTILSICRRLDGLPLAIELAAARMRTLSPNTILERIDHRLSLLTGGPRDMPERQRTLRETMEWSYGLLVPSEQRLFARLSVFAGRWTLEAAEAICGEDGPIDVLEGVSSLVDKSLLRQAVAPDGTIRYMMLQTIREFAAEQLVTAGEWEHFADLHADYYLRLAEQAEQYLRGPEQGSWTMALQEEHENLRSAMRWFLDRGNPEGVSRMAWALWIFWWVRGHTREGARWLRELLDSGKPMAPIHLARATGVYGAMLYFEGEFERGIQIQQQATALLEQVDDPVGAAHNGLPLGLFQMQRGNYAESRRMLEQTRERFAALGDRMGIAITMMALGRLVAVTRPPDRWPLLNEALAIAKTAGAKVTIAGAHDNIAWTALLDGDLQQATRHAREALDISMELRQGEGATRALETIACVAAQRGDGEAAARIFGACAAYRSVMGSPMWIADRPQYAVFQQSVKDRIGEAAFSRAWAAGEGLTVEKALAEGRAIVRSVLGV